MVKPNLSTPFNFTRGQWVAISLGLLMGVSALIGAAQHLTAPPLVEVRDFSPFATQQEYDDFMREHPLLTQQAPDGVNFRYKSRISQDKKPFYQIYLIMPPVKGGSKVSSAEVAKILRSYQKEATDWFASHDEDLSKSYVQWIPNPANYEPTPTPQAKPRKTRPGSS